MLKNLFPIDHPAPPAQSAKIATVNIITGIKDLIYREGIILAGEWAELAGLDEPNIFMQDRAQEFLAQNLAGFINAMQPNSNQFTDAHASAYLGIHPTSDRPKIST